MNRRSFMRTATAIGLGASLKTEASCSSPHWPPVHYVDDVSDKWFFIQHNWICCNAECQPNDLWHLEVWPFVGQRDQEGGYKERRLIPSTALKDRLAEQGCFLGPGRAWYGNRLGLYTTNHGGRKVSDGEAWTLPPRKNVSEKA